MATSNITELPLHDVILKIMFQENTEKAASMKAEDILWKIDNPEISERKIIEVLDWLIHKKRVDLYLGKYSIHRIEFLEQKEIYENSLLLTGEKKPNKKEKLKRKETFYINPPKRRKNKFEGYLLLIVMLVFCYITYTFLALKNESQIDINTNIDSVILLKKSSNYKNLYLSEAPFHISKDSASVIIKKSIKHSFDRQNSINRNNVKSINMINVALDSIYKSHKTEVFKLKSELNNNAIRSNQLLEKIIICNFIILGFIIFLVYKRNKA